MLSFSDRDRHGCIPEGSVSAVLACHVHDNCFVFDQDKCTCLLCLPAVTAYIWSLTGEEPRVVITYLMDLRFLPQKNQSVRALYMPWLKWRVEELCFLVGEFEVGVGRKAVVECGMVESGSTV